MVSSPLGWHLGRGAGGSISLIWYWDRIGEEGGPGGESVMSSSGMRGIFFNRLSEFWGGGAHSREEGLGD